MSDLLDNQLSLLRSVAKAVENFKKIGRNNLTPAKIRSRIMSLKETWNKCLEGHSLLLKHYPESKRDLIPYFREEQKDHYEEVYQETLDFMAECLEELEPGTRQLSLLGGKDHHDVISYMMKHILTNKLAMEYTIDGLVQN